MTLSQAVAPAHKGVVAVRMRSIELVKKLYRLVETKSQKLSVIRAMNTAARGNGRGAVDKDFAEMISANAQEVLWFFGNVAKEEDDLQIIQKIEHDSYWIHFHTASAEVRRLRSKLRRSLTLTKSTVSTGLSLASKEYSAIGRRTTKTTPSRWVRRIPG